MMQKVLSLLAASAMLAASMSAAEAMPSAGSTDAGGMAQPQLILVADGCGVGRFRGVGGYCQGHRPVNVRKVCVVRGYPNAAVRRCHMVRI